jgi:hypothetical protein
MVQVALLLAFGLGQRSAPVTISGLLTEMTRRESLARWPATPYKQLQASSYDRTQTDPNDSKTWFNNADYGQFIRTEKHGDRTEWVVMENDGPGAVTRIWTPLLADKNKMLVRFYFDGSDVPKIEENFNDLMRGKGRIKPPFAFISWPEPNVEDGVGSDLYFPIPYAKGCKVTFSEVPFYYSFDYRSYSPGTSVETFSWKGFEAAQSLSSSVAGQLEFARAVSQRPSRSVGKRLSSGAAVKVDLPRGSGAISDLEVDVPSDIERQALRSTILEITFDGEKTVWAPIGDFFGCGVSLKPVTDRYRSVKADGSMACNWVMPYRKSATVRVVNLGKTAVPVKLSVATRAWKWDDQSMLFHATWRNQYPLATRPFSDWNYLEAKGQGVYVGDTLTVMNPSPAWYGEGDEKVYVDGEKFPSQLGTGTEDYYGYAWGMAEHWSSAYMSMPLRDRKGRENWMGYTTTSRVRGLDGVAFNQSLKFDMELWHWAECQVDYSVASFWYARPGATSNRLPQPEEAAKPLPEASGVIKGAIEFEDLGVASKSAGVDVSTQSGGITEGSWSSGSQLFLQAHKVGDFVEIKVPVATKGKAHVILYATKSFDYGIVRFSVNGVAVHDIDLWSEKPVASGAIDLGVFDLYGASATVRVEVTGTNPQSRGDRFYFGLDCLVLKPGN